MVETPPEQRLHTKGPTIGLGRCLALAGLAALMILIGVVGQIYSKYSRLIDTELRAGPFSGTINVYAAPDSIAPGDAIPAAGLVQMLRKSGYSQADTANHVGYFRLGRDNIEIYPGPNSYLGRGNVVVTFAAGRIAHIRDLDGNGEVAEYRLDPQLVTNVAGDRRERRRLVRYGDIPPALVHAVISAEDKRFFQHTGFDVFRLLKAAWVDMKDGRKEQGASTLSMQLARNLWLGPEKSWKRKGSEMFMTLVLEEKLPKEKIFEDYSNQVYLGRRGTFNINGFGEGALALFNKDISRLTVAEAALLAGLIQRPSYYNPFRYPDRAMERRNTVLGLMRNNGYLTEQQFIQATQSPLGLDPGDTGAVAAQYFVDLLNDDLQSHMPESQTGAANVYTTLDLNLQAAAEEAVRVGMESVDGQLKNRRKQEAIPPGQPQVALLALDPHTGEVKALCGGRDYRETQLDRALSRRQPGSVFKPFVYAAALSTAVQRGGRVFTPATVVVDEPTSYLFNGGVYEPGNFHQDYYGPVTLRFALAHSLNNATVKLAQSLGYQAIAQLAHRVGINDVQPTPALALGSYDATPFEIAGAYTIFSNEGVYVRPSLITAVRSRDHAAIYSAQPQSARVLDPRVAYLMVSMLQEVMRSGTAAGVRGRGFTVPAAGKTGTAHDGWFAGFTSRLLCVVWVGFDDNRELGLEGAKSALPVWTEFMKRALQLRPYRDARPFTAPPGIVSAEVCPQSGDLATHFCPNPYTDFFVAGTQPSRQCEMHQGLEVVPQVTSSSN